jgi:hypothetical protein
MSLALSAQGQISVLSGGAGPITFPARPTVAEGWSTISVGTAAGTITTVAQLEAAVQLLNAGNITMQVGTSTTDNPFSANAIARFNATRFRLQSKPTEVDMTVLMATLRNDTGLDISSFDVSYLHAVEPAGAETPTGMNGWFAYYSVSGAPGSWQPISAFTGLNANGTPSATITPAGWSPGLNLYIIWADDNGGGTEGGYTMDDFTVSNVITDVLPVSITITSPTNTQRIVQGVTVNVTTTTTGPIQDVDFQISGGSVLIDSTPPFGFPLDTTSFPVGAYTLQAIASDGFSQTPSEIVNFEVVANTPPTIVITNLPPPTNFLVGTAIPVNAMIADDIAVTNVDWFVDGAFYVTRAGVANLGFTYVNSLAGTHSPASQLVLPPELNAVPEPVTTTARTVRSAATSSIAATHDAVISSDIALRWSGLSRVSRTTPSAGRSRRRWVRGRMWSAMGAGYAGVTPDGAPPAPGRRRAVGSSTVQGEPSRDPGGLPQKPRRDDR